MKKTGVRDLLGPVVIVVFLALCFGASASAAPPDDTPSAGVRAQLENGDRARVIVKLRTQRPYRNEIGMSQAMVQRQRAEIAMLQQRVRGHLQNVQHRIKHEFKSIPYVALEISAAALARLEAAQLDVERIYEDRRFEPGLAESIPQIEGDLALQAGMDGTGSVIAIIDTGVDRTHPFLAGKVIDEACFASSESGTGGDCPNGQATQVGTGAGIPCSFAPFSCRHGTHVAGIAAGSGITFSGVAPGADLMAMQVFHGSQQCGFFEEVPCARAYESDIVAALERVYQLRDQFQIASVNMSLGAGAYDSICDLEYPAFAAAIDNLKAVGIATVAGAGNNGLSIGISAPACIASAVSVSAVDENNEVAFFSDVSPDLDLFAPGTTILSSVPGGGFENLDGTSMATPHVAGAWAVLQQSNPAATVDDHLALLQTTGRPVTDFRSSSPVTKPGLRLGGVVGIESPLPVLASVAPASLPLGGANQTVTVTGSGFVRSSVVLVNGLASPTTYVSDTELSATVTSYSLNTTAPTVGISVFSPPLGGGTTGSVAVDIFPPELSVSATSVEAAEPVTVTMTMGPGNRSDWIGLARVGDPETAYIEYVYVPLGATTYSWTVNMPGTAGDYEFRLFANSGYTRLATSPTVTVTSSLPEPPGPALAVSATDVGGGDAVTVTLSNGPGNNFDWIALARVGDPDATYVEYVYVPAGATTTTWTANMPATPGDYEFRLFANSGYTRLATSPTVTVTSSTTPEPPSPALAVSATDVGGGDAVTVTLSDGPGNNLDWIALARVGDPNATYVEYVYVSPGATTATWTVTMPATPGDYEFRLFANSGYTRLATSPTVTVTPSGPEPTAPALAVSATDVGGGNAVTVTLSDGPGNNLDWIALARVGDPDTTYLQTVYVPAGATTTTWTVNMPATPGDYEFRLFANNGYTRLATSPTVTVAAVAPPALAVSATDVGGGDAVTVTLSDGPGNNLDWIALARVGDPDTAYVEFVYVPAGATTTTWTANLPATPGDYEFRLFANSGYTRLATSPTVTVTSSDPEPTAPALAVSATDVGGGDAVTVTLSDGPGNNLDWIALARVGDPDTTYVEYVYVSAGATTATWTVNLPATPGDYEFRLFANNSYARLATSPAVTVAAAAPPALAVSATAVAGGDAVTVSLSGGPGNNYDWIALAAVGDPDTTYLQTVYVPAGATTTTWTVNMPGTPGDYEFRLFANNGYTRLATSPTVTVNPSGPEPPAPALAVSATDVVGGDAVTVTLSDGPGNNYDWIALARVGDPDTTYLQTVYVPAGADTVTWTVNMPATPGDYEFRLFANNGYTRLATSPTVTVADAAPPALAVNASAVAGGDAVTVTLSDGPGNNYDWIALARVGDPDATYVEYVYVPAGATTTTWTVNMPATPGDYEFRLFANSGYTRLATSPTVTVSP